MTVYATDPADQRLTIALDALTLVYHRPSGQTHMLAEPAPQVLEALAAEPADVAAIVGRLAGSHEFDAADAEPIIAARLAELEAVGLVWSAR